jgi:hypothetical protein
MMPITYIFLSQTASYGHCRHSVGAHFEQSGRSGPEAGLSAVRTIRAWGPTVRACAEQFRVPSFVLRLLARFAGFTRKFVCNGSSPPPL